MSHRSVLVITHIVYNKVDGKSALVGPYTAVCNAIVKNGFKAYTLQLPLEGFMQGYKSGLWQKEKIRKVPKVFGKLIYIKYLVDLFLVGLYCIRYIARFRRKSIIICIDPLSCLPAAVIRFVFPYKLVYYCVDFNHHRFSNSFLQKAYEFADKLCSRRADQSWVVSEKLRTYKKKKYKSTSYYVPNSPIFNPALYKAIKRDDLGIKLIWGGSCITDKQQKDLFDVVLQISRLNLDIHIFLAPTNNAEQFESMIKNLKIENTNVLNLTNVEWRQFVATCDVGLAVYDTQFGSTDFIEPLKIWDFMGVGVPFIITKEVSLSPDIIEAQVAFRLGKDNAVDNKKLLSAFLDKKNLVSKKKECLQIAQQYDMAKVIASLFRRLI